MLGMCFRVVRKGGSGKDGSRHTGDGRGIASLALPSTDNELSDTLSKLGTESDELATYAIDVAGDRQPLAAMFQPLQMPIEQFGAAGQHLDCFK